MKIRILTATLLAAAALLSLPAVAASADVALGDRGELYVVRTGAYGELFPDLEAGVPADRPVLAVDVFAEGEPMQRLLVPESEGPDVERSPSLVFEAASQTLYAIWESQREPTISALYLAGLNAGGWSDPIEISGDIAPLKGPPQVEIASEVYAAGIDGDGGVVHRTRTMFHVVWWEQADDTEEVYYAPVLLDEGVYLGWNPVLRLDGFAGADPEGASEREAPTALLRAPRLQSGRDIRSSTIGFADETSGRFVTLEARLLPAELGRIADDLRAQIIDIGRSGEPGEPGSIHRRLRAQIIDIGRELNPGLVRHFADRVIEVYDDLAGAHPERPVEALGDDLRAQIIDIGARLLTDIDSRPAGSTHHVVEIDRVDPPAGEGAAGISHLVDLRTVTRLPLPPVGQGPVEVFLSEDGRRALVSWSRDGDVLYTESRPGSEPAWTAPKKLVLGDGVQPSQVDAILRNRVSRRP